MPQRSQPTTVLAPCEPGPLENERRQRGQLAALLTVTHTVSHTLDVGQILQTIVEQMRMVIPCDECTVYLFEAADQTLRPSAMNYDAYAEVMESVRFSLGDFPTAPPTSA